jgi:two-component system, chemotaxis family, chemotaxis protein CheY
MRRYRCLVVEDSKTMRSMLAESLTRIPGMEVVEAENGLVGIRALAAQQFDLVVTDVNMPVMDGLKLVRHVRGDPRHEKTPIVIITTESAPNDRDRALALGANAYIEKPIQAPRVIRAVKKLLEV